MIVQMHFRRFAEIIMDVQNIVVEKFEIQGEATEALWIQAPTSDAKIISQLPDGVRPPYRWILAAVDDISFVQEPTADNDEEVKDRIMNLIDGVREPQIEEVDFQGDEEEPAPQSNEEAAGPANAVKEQGKQKKGSSKSWKPWKQRKAKSHTGDNV